MVFAQIWVKNWLISGRTRVNDSKSFFNSSFKSNYLDGRELFFFSGRRTRCPPRPSKRTSGPSSGRGRRRPGRPWRRRRRRRRRQRPRRRRSPLAKFSWATPPSTTRMMTQSSGISSRRCGVSCQRTGDSRCSWTPRCSGRGSSCGSASAKVFIYLT